MILNRADQVVGAAVRAALTAVGAKPARNIFRNPHDGAPVPSPAVAKKLFDLARKNGWKVPATTRSRLAELDATWEKLQRAFAQFLPGMAVEKYRTGLKAFPQKIAAGEEVAQQPALRDLQREFHERRHALHGELKRIGEEAGVLAKASLVEYGKIVDAITDSLERPLCEQAAEFGCAYAPPDFIRMLRRVAAEAQDPKRMPQGRPLAMLSLE